MEGEIGVHRRSSPGSEARMRSSNRLRYDAEVEFLKRQNGDLESIRLRLGMSRRKMCQTLMVDPSAWTRWTSPGQSAPPHIYIALDWYISMMEKDPEYRRLAMRFAEWLNHEKNHEGRLASLEALLSQTGAPRPNGLNWRPWVALSCAFCAGICVAFLILKMI